MEENASNALVMAGGVLLAIMILSLIVVSFKSSADFAKDYEENIEQLNLQAFNNQFEIYNNRSDLTIRDIVTVANLARDMNKKNGVENDEKSPYYIKVRIYGETKKLEKSSKEDLVAYMESHTFKEFNKDNAQADLQKYKCVGISDNGMKEGIGYSDITKKVNAIIFKKIE